MNGENKSDKKEIRIEGLYKAYGAKTVFENLDLRVPCGEISALMAPSGYGKTTLLRLISGLEKPDGGRIVFPHEPFRISMCFQEDRLIEQLDALENICLANKNLGAEDARTALYALGLGDTAEGKPVSEFSGGMRRRVSLLRALLAEWDLLLLDEPFEGLDAATRARTAISVKNYIAALPKESTAIIVSHNKRDIELLDAKLLSRHLPGEVVGME